MTAEVGAGAVLRLPVAVPGRVRRRRGRREDAAGTRSSSRPRYAMYSYDFVHVLVAAIRRGRRGRPGQGAAALNEVTIAGRERRRARLQRAQPRGRGRRRRLLRALPRHDLRAGARTTRSRRRSRRSTKTRRRTMIRRVLALLMLTLTLGVACGGEEGEESEREAAGQPCATAPADSLGRDGASRRLPAARRGHLHLERGRPAPRPSSRATGTESSRTPTRATRTPSSKWATT